MGLAYQKLGNYDEARQYYEQALHIRQILFGDNHHDVATSFNNVGVAYDKLEKCAQALEYYCKALDIFKGIRTLPSENPDVAASLNNVGVAYE